MLLGDEARTTPCVLDSPSRSGLQFETGFDASVARGKKYSSYSLVTLNINHVRARSGGAVIASGVTMWR